MSDIKEPEQIAGSKFSLSKKESKIFSIIVKYGPQTKKEILLASEIQADKFDEACDSLQTKGLILMDDGVFYSALPINNMLSLLESSFDEIETNKKEQLEISQDFRKNTKESLLEFNKSLEEQLNELKTANNLLQASLRDDLDALEKQRVKKSNNLADELLENYSVSTSDLKTEIQSSFSSHQLTFEKEWTKFVNEFQNIPETGTRSLKDSITKYEKELSSVINSTTDKINSIQSQFSDIFTVIETEALTQIQEFYSNVESAAEEFRNNIDTGLRESWKHEKEFVNDVRQQVQTTLEDEISTALKKVVSSLAKEIDKGINEALKHVKQQTNTSISESSLQLKTEFKEFAETASELILEQRSSLEVLSTELSEMSSEKKLVSQRDLFIKQLNSKLSAEMNILEGNYRRIQKNVTEIMENIRRSAKDRLIQQSSEFEKLVYTFNEVNEKSISRKDMDVTRLLQLSQSVSQFLRNLLITIPGSANQFKTTLRDQLENTKNEIKKTTDETSSESIKDINNNLSNSQKRVEMLFQETSDENKREIENVIISSEQLSTTISNLQETYSEKIESRFEQRAKVMNTELEAVARNFQQVLNGIQSGFGGINDRISSENLTRITNIETSMQTSASSLKNNLDTIFTQNKTQNTQFSKMLEADLGSHLDRTLEVIKEGFSQIKTEFNLELEKQLDQISKQNEKQQNDFQSVIENFSDQTSNQLNEFKNNLTTSIDENERNIGDFISENQRTTNEVVNLHKANIVKYQEKGPTDILNFINQIEAEVSTHNKNLKEAMDGLASYYAGLSDSTMNEVSGLIRQVQESGDKLTAIANDSLQILTSNLARTSESIDMYFSDSLANLENQIGVVTGFVTSEVDTAAENVKNEVEILRSEMKQTVEDLNSEIKDFVAQQDQEFQTKIPELSSEFSQVFNDIMQERTKSDQELQDNIEKDLEKLIANWTKEMQKAKDTLQDVTNAVDKAIGSSLENFEVIVSKNVGQAIKRIDTIFDFDSSKEDIFGLREIQSKVKQSNKRLKSAISETLQSHISKFEERLPEIVTSYEAVHNQTEEDLSSHIEDLRDLISSSHTSLTNQIHEYIKSEREDLDFAEMKDELKELIRNFSQSTSHEIESLSVDLADIIKASIDQVDKSREEIESLLNEIPTKMSDQDANLLKELTKFKETALKSVEDVSIDSKKELVSFLEIYSNDLEKSTLGTTGKSTKLVQSLTEDLEKKTSELQQSANSLLDQLISANTIQKESLQELAKLISSTKPEQPIRLVNLPTNDARNDYINEIIRNASKQVTIFTSNPTFLSPEDLKSIPSGKRLWIYTSYDFTKKGKKWLSEVGDQVNINLRKAKTEKITGLILVQDEESALVLPEALGFTTTDTKFISYLSELLNLLKGSSLRKRSR
jgi:sugar-specific transcriptional regulator TrmB